MNASNNDTLASKTTSAPNSPTQTQKQQQRSSPRTTNAKNAPHPLSPSMSFPPSPKSPKSTVIPTIHIADLSIQKKEKIFSIILSQNSTLTQTPEGNYYADIRLPEYVIHSLASSPKPTPTNKTSPTLHPIITDEKIGNYENKGNTSQRGIIHTSNSVLESEVEKICFMLCQRYPRFSSLVLSRENIPPRPHSPQYPMKLIDEMYDFRYRMEVKEMKANEQQQYDLAQSNIINKFPDFVCDFFVQKYGLKTLIEQNCWDLMYNIELYRRKYLALEIFSLFLGEVYNMDDIIFFLFARHVIHSDLGFLNPFNPQKLKYSNNKQRPVFIPIQQCLNIAKQVFKFTADTLFNSFKILLSSYNEMKKRNLQSPIEINELFYLLLVEYHKSKPTPPPDQNNNNNNNDNNNIHYDEENINDRTQDILTPIPQTHSNDSLGSWDRYSDENENESDDENVHNIASEEEELVYRREIEAVTHQLANLRSATQTPQTDHLQNLYPYNLSQPNFDLSDALYIELGNQLNSYLVQHSPLLQNKQAYTEILERTLADELSEGLQFSINEYLDILLRVSSGLPSQYIHSIRKEVDGHLQTLLANSLKDVQLGNVSPNTTTNTTDIQNWLAYRAELQDRLNNLVKLPFSPYGTGMQFQEEGEEEEEKEKPSYQDQEEEEEALRISELRRVEVRAFCNALIGSPDVRRRIEPLVAYMVTTARRDLGLASASSANRSDGLYTGEDVANVLGENLLDLLSHTNTPPPRRSKKDRSEKSAIIG